MINQFRILIMILTLGPIAASCSAAASSDIVARITIPYVGGWPKTATPMPHMAYMRYNCAHKGPWEQKEHGLLSLVDHEIADGNIHVTVVRTPEDNRPRAIELTLSKKCRVFMVSKGNLDEMLCVLCKTEAGKNEAHCFMPGTSGRITCTSVPCVATIEELQRFGATSHRSNINLLS